MTAILNITPMGELVDGGANERAQLLRPIGDSKNFSLGASTARTALPAAGSEDDRIVAYRLVALAGPCYIKGGSDSVTAAAGDIAVPQNGEFYLPAKSSYTFIAGLDA